MSIVLYTSGNDPVLVEDQPIDTPGGEGAVHRVISPSAYIGLCVKLFEKNNPLREKKIDYMVRNPPKNLQSDGYLICWPKESVYQCGKFVGFIMPLAYGGSERLDKLCPPSNKLSSIWHAKYDRATRDGMIARLKLCANIAIAIHSIHALKHYVLKDMKPENIMVTNHGKVSIIDLDSIQIANQNQVIFPASSVNTPDYAPPESSQFGSSDYISDTWDRFSIAVIFYKLLFCLHPYAGTFSGKYQDNDNTNIPSYIRGGLFVFGSRKGHVLFLPPWHNNFKKTPRSLQDLFMQAFDKGHDNPTLRPTVENWGKELHSLLNGTQANVQGQNTASPSPSQLAKSISNGWPVKLGGLSRFIGLALIGIPILLVLSLFIPKQKSPEAPVAVPRAASNPNNRQNIVETQPEVNNQPEINNQPGLTEPQDVSNFTITIRSSPPGATVSLDRNRAGITPFTTTLEKGIYGVEIKKEGYQRKIGQIKDGQQDFYVELSPE